MEILSLWSISRLSIETINGMIADRNYYYFCRVGVTYNEEKIKNIKKMSLIHNYFLENKKDIQLCIDFNLVCDKFYMYHYKKSYIMRLGNCKWRYLNSYINEYIYRLCWNDNWQFFSDYSFVTTKFLLTFVNSHILTLYIFCLLHLVMELHHFLWSFVVKLASGFDFFEVLLYK